MKTETKSFYSTDQEGSTLLIAEYTRDALNLTVTSSGKISRRVTIEILTVRLNRYGLTEAEVILTTRAVQLYRAGEDSLIGCCSILGTFYPDWSDRLYFRLIDSQR